MDPEATRFARSYQRFIEAMASAASSEAISPVRTLLDEHLGVDSSTIPVISDSFPAYDHVNVQVALTNFLEVDGRSYRLVGLDRWSVGVDPGRGRTRSSPPAVHRRL
jgi:hypothetical protein